MREVIIKLALMSVCLILFAWFSYECGKRAADRYYAEHPVTLIQPINLRAPEPVASIKGKGSSSNRIDVKGSGGTRPLANVEEPQ